MNRTALSLVALPAIAAAALLLADPTQALAQRGGGHGGGGFHSGGGFHAGAVGGYHGGAVGGYHGGFNGGGFAGNYHPGYRSYGGYSGYRPGYYGSSYYPYYSGYGYYGASYPDYGSTLTYGSSDWSVPPVDSGNAAPPLQAAPSYPAASAGNALRADHPPAGALEESSPAPVAPADSSATLTINVPADAELWFDETKTTSTGPVRLFNTPPLTPGRNYSYEIRAHWTEGGHDVTQTQTVGVTAGANLSVNFPLPAGASGQGGTNPSH